MQSKPKDLTDSHMRYASVDIVRGIAMIMVILVHYGQNYSIGFAKAFQYLQMGCPLFFVASGFGIMCLIGKRYKGSLSKENLGQFYFSRFKALAPGWYIALLGIILVNSILLFFTGKTLSFGTNRKFPSVICNILFLHGLLPFCNNDVMPGGWFVGTTVILYLLTPLILKGLVKAGNKKIFFAISSFAGMLFWFLLHFAFPENFQGKGFGYYFFPVHYPEYLLGMILFYDLSEGILQDKKIGRFLLCGIGSFIISVALFYSGLPLCTIPSAWMAGLSAYFFLYYLISNEIAGKRKVKCRALEHFGISSYYIYLLHAFFAWTFVSSSLNLLADTGVSQTVLFFVLIPVTLLLSYAAGSFFHKIIVRICSNAPIAF